MIRKTLFVAFAILSLSACSKDAPEVDDYDPARDYYTFANTDQFVTEHVALDLDIDFDAQVFRGYAMLTMRRLDPAATEVILDTRDLDIVSAVVLTGESSAAAEHRLGEADDLLGTPLIVTLPADSGERF